jgi:ubiquinone/menaquinone biosynthesis C-methylase UbiE
MYMVIMRKFLNQWRKPTGCLGALVAWTLNISHAKVNDWGFRHVAIEKLYTILDVGCGGGMTVRRLAGVASQGKVYGIDFSEECVSVSRRTNRQFVQNGRVEIRQASVSRLPFSDNMFDLVTAVDSHYYWPDLIADMQEVLRVLKPGGRLVILGETYKGGKYGRRDRQFVEVTHLAYLSLRELGELISTAGYSQVKMFEDYDRGWVCAIGTKPV